MTIASCLGVSATTLDLPVGSAIPADKSLLPLAAFYTRPPVSTRLKQHFINGIESVTMLSLLRPSTTGLDEGKKIKEVLVLGVQLKTGSLPMDALEHMAMLRPPGILFVCVRQAALAGDPQAEVAPDGTAGDGTAGGTCCLVVRRPLPTKVGHEARHAMYSSPWSPSDKTRLTMSGNDMDGLWESLNAQVILGSDDPEDLDARVANRDHIADLQAQERKLAGDHARARSTAQRNEIYAKLHKVRTELEGLGGQAE